MRLVESSQAPAPAARPTTIPPLAIATHPVGERILDFDLETLAAGFADPDWVPQKITVAAWSWIGQKKVHHLVTGKEGFFNRKLRGERLAPLLDAISQADVVTGHNLIRFDLPVLNAECARCGLPPLKPIKVDDTIRLRRTKGLKKGQDNIAHNFGLREKKMKLDWSEWDEAYEEEGWPRVVKRCVTDVQQHKAMREAVRPWQKPRSVWRP